MNKKLYIRFSDDIYEDIERGHSYFKGKSKLKGLCAWPTSFFYNYGKYVDYSGREVSEDDIIDDAKNILRNTYGSYSNNDQVHLITGDYAGDGNDGVLLKNVDVVETFYL